MRVVIDIKVHRYIEKFYNTALDLRVALDEETVIKKVERLYAGLEQLGKYAMIYPQARLRKEWIENGYREFLCEDFHFAYVVVVLEDGEEVVRICDACHSYLYTD